VGSTRHTERDLCYLEAQNVEIAAGKLADLEVCSRDDEKLGGVDGVLIEPSARRIRYFVVKSPGWFRKGRYLVPVEDLARVETDQQVLRIETSAADVGREAFTPDAVRPFTDEDVVTVMFAPTAA
jgi:uncharacterized protein YrrD